MMEKESSASSTEKRNSVHSSKCNAAVSKGGNKYQMNRRAAVCHQHGLSFKSLPIIRTMRACAWKGLGGEEDILLTSHSYLVKDSPGNSAVGWTMR